MSTARDDRPDRESLTQSTPSATFEGPWLCWALPLAGVALYVATRGLFDDRAVPVGIWFLCVTVGAAMSVAAIRASRTSKGLFWHGLAGLTVVTLQILVVLLAGLIFFLELQSYSQ